MPLSLQKFRALDATKKIIPILMLVLASADASAGIEWTSIGSAQDQEVTYYLDFQSFHKQGHTVTAWELMDFNSPQQFKGNSVSYLSSTLLMEFDCDKTQSRILTFNMYAGPMGTKDIVYTANFPSADWKPIPPESMEKQLWDSACVKSLFSILKSLSP